MQAQVSHHVPVLFMLQVREQALAPAAGQSTVGAQVAGVLCFVVRQHKLPLLLSDIASTAGASPRQVARCYR